MYSSVLRMRILISAQSALRPANIGPKVLIYLGGNVGLCTNESHDLLGEAIKDFFGYGSYKIRSVQYSKDLTLPEQRDIWYRHSIQAGTCFARIALMDPNDIFEAMIRSKNRAVSCGCCIGAVGIATIAGPDIGEGFPIHVLKYKDRKSLASHQKKTVSFAESSCLDGRIQKGSLKSSSNYRISKGARRSAGLTDHSSSKRKSRLAAYSTRMLDASKAVPVGSPDENVEVMGTIIEEPQQSRGQELVDDLSSKLGGVNLGSNPDEDMVL